MCRCMCICVHMHARTCKCVHVHAKCVHLNAKCMQFVHASAEFAQNYEIILLRNLSMTCIWECRGCRISVVSRNNFLHEPVVNLYLRMQLHKNCQKLAFWCILQGWTCFLEACMFSGHTCFLGACMFSGHITILLIGWDDDESSLFGFVPTGWLIFVCTRVIKVNGA